MSTPLERSRKATSIGQFLEEAATLYTGKSAFSCGAMNLGYSEFAEQGKAFASYLQSVGVNKGDRVALMVPIYPRFPLRHSVFSNPVPCRSTSTRNIRHQN